MLSPVSREAVRRWIDARLREKPATESYLGPGCAAQERHTCSSYISVVHRRRYRSEFYVLDALGHIAIADLGVGIRRHLANNPAYAGLASDVLAIEEAIQRVHHDPGSLPGDSRSS